MLNRTAFVLLASVSVALASCTSIKNSPGHRKNVHSNSLQRSAAIKELPQANLAPAMPHSRLRAAAAPIHQDPPRGRTASISSSSGAQPKDMELILGHQQYFRPDVPVHSVTSKAHKGATGVALNFERASIREVVSVVLGEILKYSYIVEPGVDGEVTINSSSPIAREALIPTLEALLQTQGAVLYKDEVGHYRVTSRANIRSRGFVPTVGKIKPGYSLQIVPLRYIPVTEMQKILEPLASPDAFVRVDTGRNLLILAGTSAELQNLNATIRTFDVDVLQGMSVGIYRIKNIDAQVVAKNLDSLFGEGGNSPMAGMVKVVTLEHMNSLMLMSPSADYLREMKVWIDRFDQMGPVDGQQLYVYRVQHGNAEHIASMLTQIFSGRSNNRPSRAPSGLAPNLTPATVSAGGLNNNQVAALIGIGADGLSVNTDAEVKIVADKTNNSLMILASESMYRQIQEALKRIDTMPMQVQVEASILEVTLTDGLEHGLQWYFKNNGNSFGGMGLGNAMGSTQAPGGFSFSLSGGGVGLQSFISALARDSKVKVISSPSILVLDNQTAEIRVGDQQPIYTGNVSTSTSGVGQIETIQYKDTGVSLKVTPQVNANGLVRMDIQQDITDVGEIDSATGNRSFLQRNIKSNIAVQSGETIVLGGLIRDNTTTGSSGVPVLKNLPMVGGLFNNTSHSTKRTELLVLITPTAIKDQQDLVKTGAEMRDRMRRLMNDNSFMNQLQGARRD